MTSRRWGWGDPCAHVHPPVLLATVLRGEKKLNWVCRAEGEPFPSSLRKACVNESRPVFKFVAYQCQGLAGTAGGTEACLLNGCQAAMESDALRGDTSGSYESHVPLCIPSILPLTSMSTWDTHTGSLALGSCSHRNRDLSRRGGLARPAPLSPGALALTVQSRDPEDPGASWALLRSLLSFCMDSAW